jgi:hypothetical protein
MDRNRPISEDYSWFALAGVVLASVAAKSLLGDGAERSRLLGVFLAAPLHALGEDRGLGKAGYVTSA